MSSDRLDDLKTRIDRLEKRDVEEVLTMIEIMSNVTFFGEMKRAECEFSKDGQCGLYYLNDGAKVKVPVATECRIQECNVTEGHRHLEANNITCSFCPRQNAADLGQTSKERSLERTSR